MATYSSKPAVINRHIQEIFDRFSDLSNLQNQLKELPEDQLARIGDVKFDTDSIAINTPQVGEIKFQVTERVAPGKIVFGSPSSPIPLNMILTLKSLTVDSTEVVTAIDVEIPMMLRPLIGGKLQEAADQFSKLMSQLSR